MYKNVVILIPGILGSALSKDGTEIWGMSAGTIARGAFSAAKNLNALKLCGDDPNADDLGDGVVATRLLPDLHLIPGLWKIDGYADARTALLEHLDLVTDRNFFEFPYDWRRDTRVAARLLQQKARTWLRRWRESSGNGDARLILVAHSLGGLVARHFVEVLGGWQETAVLATFGTPFRGSPKALRALSNGLQGSVGSFRIYDLSEIVRSLTSVYQLLPIYKAYDSGNGQLARLTETASIKNISRDRAAAAMKFHNDISTAQALNAKLSGYDEGYRLLPFVGIDQPTFGFARSASEGVELLRRHTGYNYNGDGTVPRFSAMPPEWANEQGATFFANTHASLQNTTAALTHLCAVLKGADTDLSRFRAGRILAPLGLDIDDAYPSEEPVTIRATSQKYFQFLDAVVSPTDSNLPAIKARLWPSGESYEAKIALQPGAYRIEVTAREAIPVNDVFIVGPSAST